MKQNLNIGNAVDDSTGDYLREGGQKLNANFDELYYQLGNGSFPHAAGAWKTIATSNGNVVNAEFGKAYTVNTSAGQMQIKLPKGTTADYNNVIRIRDVFGTWQTNPVTIAPALGDTMKGFAGSKTFSTNLTDLELVYCAPGRWEYVATKRLNKISNDDVNTVVRKEYIATAGQTDFPNVFDGTIFSLINTQVYRRGNLLYYGKDFSENSDYGSIGLNNSLVALDGVSIKLREPCEAGDALIIVTYLDGIAQWRSTYNRLDATILDINETNKKSINGAVIVADLNTLNEITVEQMGYVLSSNSGLINPTTFEVYVNGVFLNEAGTAGLPFYRCEGASGETSEECIANNGTWKSSFTDYQINMDENEVITSMNFDRKFESGDIITIKWFNNDIGTTMTIDEITEITDDKYISSQNIQLTGTVRVTDYSKPQWPNVEENGTTQLSVASPYGIFDMIYPIGSIYENSINPNNPSTYMGFGSWTLFAEKQVLIGWTKDNQDNLFHYNNNDLNSSGVASATAGGTGGNRLVEIKNENLPKTMTDEKVLIADDNGNIIIGGCQFDPDSAGPAYDKYREERAITNATNVPPKSLDTLPPYTTVYRWMRIA